MTLFMDLLALISLVVLGSGLKDLTFLPMKPFSHSDSEAVRVSAANMITRIVEIPAWKQAAFWILISIFILLILSLLSPELRKRLLMGILRTGLFVIVIFYVTKNNPEFIQRLFSFNKFGANIGDASLLKNNPPPVFDPPHVSGWLSFITGFFIILLVAGLIWRINRWRLRQKELHAIRRPLDEIANAARLSLQELSLGNISSYDSIIRCYERMIDVVNTKRGLARDLAMTPSEFETYLEKAGLPTKPVSRLTRLFETVRYGLGISSQSDMDEAISCLSSILQYCGETV